MWDDRGVRPPLDAAAPAAREVAARRSTSVSLAGSSRQFGPRPELGMRSNSVPVRPAADDLDIPHEQLTGSDDTHGELGELLELTRP